MDKRQISKRFERWKWSSGQYPLSILWHQTEWLIQRCPIDSSLFSFSSPCFHSSFQLVQLNEQQQPLAHYQVYDHEPRGDRAHKGKSFWLTSPQTSSCSSTSATQCAWFSGFLCELRWHWDSAFRKADWRNFLRSSDSPLHNFISNPLPQLCKFYLLQYILSPNLLDSSTRHEEGNTRYDLSNKYKILCIDPSIQIVLKILPVIIYIL